MSCALRKPLPFELTITCRIRTLEEDKERFRPIGYRDLRRVGPAIDRLRGPVTPDNSVCAQP